MAENSCDKFVLRRSKVLISRPDPFAGVSIDGHAAFIRYLQKDASFRSDPTLRITAT